MASTLGVGSHKKDRDIFDQVSHLMVNISVSRNDNYLLARIKPNLDRSPQRRYIRSSILGSGSVEASLPVLSVQCTVLRIVGL